MVEQKRSRMHKTRQGERRSMRFGRPRCDRVIRAAIARVQASRPGLSDIRAGPLKPHIGARLGSAYGRLGLKPGLASR